MSTDTAPAVIEKPKAVNPATLYRQQVSRYAGAVLSDWVGEERAREATGRIAAAMSAAAAASKDPSEFYKCTPQSVATCIAVAALTGIMPGTGPSALAYVTPQRPRRDDPPQLQYNLSHRGINALAGRCNRTMIAIPISNEDAIEFNEDGEVATFSRNVDNPPTTFEELRGVVIMVKQLDSGTIIFRGWMPKKLIEKRRAMSRSWGSEKGQKYSPWYNWPVEMAMKTAMHYAISRGWCVIDDTEAVRALTVDAESDLDQPLLPAPVAESRSEAVANLLMDEPAVEALGEAQAAVESSLRSALHESLERRISEMDTPADAVDIQCELDEASRGNLLPPPVLRELGKSLAARCTELTEPADAK